jgi:hypothetical protein
MRFSNQQLGVVTRCEIAELAVLALLSNER